MGGGGEIIAGGGWWRQNYGWLWVVVGGGNKIMAGRGWSWMIARFSNAHLDFDFQVTLSLLSSILQ